MSSLRYYTLDVFTDTAFGGNPLAVFVDAEGLDSQLMQQLAKELNLSETVFIGQSTAPNRYAVRIFTPAEEIPFAGHPTVGTALLLFKLGMLTEQEKDSNSIELILEEGVGDIAVTIQKPSSLRKEPVARFRTAQLPESQPSSLTQQTAAQILSVQPAQIVSQPFIASCGLPFHMIELENLAAVSAADLDSAALKQHLGNDTLQDIYLFCREGRKADIHARMFAPMHGISEDPATGSAASALVGIIARNLPGQGVQKLSIEQGVEMGRPSYIHTDVLYENSDIKAVYVAGQAVLVSEGTFLVQLQSD
ncbi:PhzF family phenazine biosynthesis protein [Motiliproteus sp. MSK22-1]|uniref:PhzF family phenazine biosynthesis protein n=1 Tax=Motiliproteus sp. MSK22-1 TaxID=1897630 RepID=UPI000976A848|nr:PhzF family phenazine biosynthesis protein [Motiliproteus sp. MSK22-1]OMH33922.1 hypothetical protein BGP75_13200 [Motiliproteus sp. MSK22-1]